ncbi:MAG TPA: cohesin domain-containing protein [Dongiaceae bacterium]|nr:cohesin domain-containing protein [Dongiaceae bacterium]
MKNIFVTAAMSLLVASICSCSGTNCLSSDSASSGKAVAAPYVTSVQSDASSYSIRATDLDGVAGIQLDITYDASSLATPTVTQGALVAGALFVANTATPGLIKIAIISTNGFSGSGEIALVSFASKTGSGGITSISASMIDSQGALVPASGSAPTTATSTPHTSCR